MSFAKDIQELMPKIDLIMKATKKLSDEKIDMLQTVSKFKKKDLDAYVIAVKSMKENIQQISDVLSGMDSIAKVLTIQNQVQNVSDNRDVISQVAGALDDIREVKIIGHSICKISGMESTIVSVLDMKDDIEMVLFNKDKIEDINQTVLGMQDVMQNMENMYLKVGSKLDEIKKVELEITRQSQLVDINLNAMKTIQNQLQTFKIESFNIDNNEKGYSKYESNKNTLKLFIPQGKEGKEGKRGPRGNPGSPGISGAATKEGREGKPGRDGKDFHPTIFGTKRELRRFGNRPKGTSLLTLDESPTVIYFKKSDALDDWSDGQPFGIINGEDATRIDANTIDGFTLDQIYKHIENAFERMQNGT